MLVALYKVRCQNLILLGAKTKCWSDQTLAAIYKVRFQNLILLGAKTKCWSDQTLAAIYNFLRLEPSRYFTPFLSATPSISHLRNNSKAISVSTLFSGKKSHLFCFKKDTFSGCHKVPTEQLVVKI